MNTPAITTTTQTFLTNDEPMAQLMSAMLSLMNNSAFDILPDKSKVIILETLIDLKGGTPKQRFKFSKCTNPEDLMKAGPVGAFMYTDEEAGTALHTMDYKEKDGNEISKRNRKYMEDSKLFPFAEMDKQTRDKCIVPTFDKDNWLKDNTL